MDLKEITTRLNYVGELLQSLQHFTSSSMHACCCEVCTHITSLQRTCIKRAAQEVGLVSHDLRSNKNLLALAADSKSLSTPCPIVNPNCRESGPGVEGNPIVMPVQGMIFNSTSRLSGEQQIFRVNLEGENPAPQVLSSTMKDSGLQATASSSDWSASPIYDAESACDSYPYSQMPVARSSCYGVIQGGASKPFHESFHPWSEHHKDKRCELESQSRSLCMPGFPPAPFRSEMHNLTENQLTSRPASMPNAFAFGLAPQSSSLETPPNNQKIVAVTPENSSNLYNEAVQGLITPSEGFSGPPTSLFGSMQNETPRPMTPSTSRGWSNCSSIAMNTVIDMNSRTLSAPLSMTPTLSAAGKNPLCFEVPAPKICDTAGYQNPTTQDFTGTKPETGDIVTLQANKETPPSLNIERDSMIQQEGGFKLSDSAPMGTSHNGAKDSNRQAEGDNIPHQLETSLANLSLDSDNLTQKAHHNRNQMDAPHMTSLAKEDVANLCLEENQPLSVELDCSQCCTPSVDTIVGNCGESIAVTEIPVQNKECLKSDFPKTCDAEELNYGPYETKESILGLLQHCTAEDELGVGPKSQSLKSIDPPVNQDPSKFQMCNSGLLSKGNELQEKVKTSEDGPKELTNINKDKVNKTVRKSIFNGDKMLNEISNKENKYSLLSSDTTSSIPDKPAIDSNGKLIVVEENQTINEYSDKDYGENFSSPRKAVRPHQSSDCFINPKNLLEDQSLKCMSNFEFSPRKSHSQQTMKAKPKDQRYSLPNHNVVPSGSETSTNSSEQLPSPQKRPAMGVRRSLDMFRSNKNNNTNNLGSQEKSRSFFLSVKSSNPNKDQAKITTAAKISGKNATANDQNIKQDKPFSNKQDQSTQKLAWGAPAYGDSRYLSPLPTEEKTDQAKQSKTKAAIVKLANESHLEKGCVPNEHNQETGGIEQTVPIKRSHKIECCMFQEPSNIDRENTVGSKLMSRHHLDMIMESPNMDRLKHRSEFNSSLPVSLLKTETQSHDLGLESDEKMESYEGNQSFPKSAGSHKQSTLEKPNKSCYSTQKLFGDKAKSDDKRKSNALGAEKTPRNRRSIFGHSPPDQHQQGRQRSPPHQRINHLQLQSPRAQGSPAESSSRESQQEPQSSASEEGVSSGSEGRASQAGPWHDHLAVDAACLDALWEALDVTTMLTQPQNPAPPSMQEILFNTVTSSLCIVNKRRTGKIVSVNESFQLLIGLHEKVVGQRLLRFLKFTDSPESLGRSCPQSFIRADGSVLSVAGTLAKCVDSRGQEYPVTVWMLPLVSQPSLAVCIVDVTTPLSSELRLLPEGQVVSLDDSFEEMLGLGVGDDGQMCEVTGLDFNKTNTAQNVRLETDNFEVPVSVLIDGTEEEGSTEEGELLVYHGNITLYGNLCGLLVVDVHGRIIFNDNYFKMFLGYTDLSEQAELWEIISEVTRIGDDSEERTLSVCGDNAIPDSSSNRSQLLDITLRDVNHLRAVLSGDDVEIRPKLYLPSSCFRQHEDLTFEELSVEENCEDSQNRDKVDEEKNRDCVDNIFQEAKIYRKESKFDHTPQGKIWTPPKNTSTPQKAPVKCRQLHQEEGNGYSPPPGMVALDHGIFKAMFLHASGDKFFGSFKVGSILTSASGWQYCVWVYLHITDGNDESSCQSSVKSNSQGQLVAKEPDVQDSNNDYEDDDDDDGDKEDLEAIDRTVDPSLGQIIVDHAGLNQSHNATSEEDILDLESAIDGTFRKKYFVRQALGQGSFGFVRRAMAIDCKESVIVKFIKKRNMFSDGWTVDVDSGQKIPLEVAILKDLDSEYIIKVLDVYQNADFVQMVMEDFGDVDLFDFIDQVCLDEPLACHLFRQILWGVDYLHNCGIVHRDIKDENVVLRKDFRCKLIDFGSAVYILPGDRRFTRFRGTMEYCSPEVFDGKSYRGPELDMWALGVTLYTMVYRVNPFSVDDMPQTFSQLEFPEPDGEEEIIGDGDMLELLYGLLKQDPSARHTMEQALRCEWLRMIVNLKEYCWEDLFGGEMQPDQLLDSSGFVDS